MATSQLIVTGLVHAFTYESTFDGSVCPMTEPQRQRITAESVRAVLWQWDPIGVKAISSTWPGDEYDDLVEPLLRTLSYEPSKEELAQGLHELLNVQYGLPSPHGCREAATALHELLAVTQSSRSSARQNVTSEETAENQM